MGRRPGPWRGETEGVRGPRLDPRKEDGATAKRNKPSRRGEGRPERDARRVRVREEHRHSSKGTTDEGTATRGRAPVRSARRGRIRIRWDRVALLLALAASMAALLYTYFHTGVFHVSEVRVTGNRRLDSAYVVSLSGIGHGDNVLTFDGKAAAARLEEEPWIKRAGIRRHFPDKVELVIEEREAVAQVEAGEGFLLADLDGCLLESSSVPWPGFPVLLVEDPVGLVGGRLTGEDFRREAEVLRSMSVQMQPKVASLGCDERRGAYLVTGEGIRVFLGDGEDLPLKLENAFAIMEDPEVRRKYPLLDYVDVSCPGEPVICPRPG